MNLDEIAQDQREHWKALAKEHAGTVYAVGSESLVHKYLRYEKLSELFAKEKQFTLHEIGPGIGDFYGWLQSKHPEFQTIDYSASEITAEYCDIARQRYPGIKFYNRDIISESVDETYDYVILSGVFHQQGGVSHRHWISYMESLLKVAWSMANRGVAFNVITSYADFYKPGNFYADLGELQLFIVRRLSRFFRLDCSYPLFEGTFLVIKPDEIKETYQQAELIKYLAND